MSEAPEKQNFNAQKRRGRPPKEPSWLKSVAEAVGRGASLRRALWRERIYGLSESEIRNIYRWVKFRRYMEEARIAYFREYGRVPKRARATPIEKLLAKVNAPTIEDQLLNEAGTNVARDFPRRFENRRSREERLGLFRRGNSGISISNSPNTPKGRKVKS
jgi:hypothetical protein